METYQRLAELGILREDTRVELIEGQVVEMSPIGARHAACVRRLNRLFAQALLDVAFIDVQNPVVLGTRNAPQPDLAVLALRPHGYPTHPRAEDTLLVVEVADTTLAYDRDVKLPLYARAAVPEVWLVDVAAEQVHVHRDPVGDHYASVRSVSPPDAITVLRFPQVTIGVAEILG